MRRAASLALWGLILALVAVVMTVTLVPRVAGLTPVNIVAGSMTPTYPFGTLVLVDKQATPAIGSVITYKFGENSPVTHRVTAIRPDPSGNDIEYVTRGDANVTDDAQPVPPGAVVGVVTASVPFAGLVTTLLSKPHVLLFLATLACGLYWASRPAQPSRVRPEGLGEEVTAQ